MVLLKYRVGLTKDNEMTEFRKYEDEIETKEGMEAINIHTGEVIHLTKRQSDIYNELKEADYEELMYVDEEKLRIFNILSNDYGINPGEEKEYYRTGNKPHVGYISHNYRDQKDEKGISVYPEKKATSFAGMASETWWEGRGRQVAWGSDDEPVIVVTSDWVKSK
jgi:hypothetical protein